MPNNSKAGNEQAIVGKMQIKGVTMATSHQGSKFIFGFGSTCATRCKFLGALPKF